MKPGYGYIQMADTQKNMIKSIKVAERLKIPPEVGEAS